MEDFDGEPQWVLKDNRHPVMLEIREEGHDLDYSISHQVYWDCNGHCYTASHAKYRRGDCIPNHAFGIPLLNELYARDCGPDGSVK